LPFVHDRFYRAFCDNSGLGHFFHGVDVAFAFTVNLPYLTEATFADAVVVNEVVFGDSYD
jgi:hypothetical protein